MILKKLYTENPKKSLFSRKRRARGGEKVLKYLYLVQKKFFAGGEKENRATE